MRPGSTRTRLPRPLPESHADDVALLAERLALVAETVRGTALRADSERGDTTGPAARERDHAAWPAELELDDAAWLAELEREIARSRAGRAPLSLLLLELEDAHRLIAVEPPAEAQGLLARLHATVRGAIGPQELVVWQPGGRAWVITRGTGRAGADELGSRLAQAIQSSTPWRGAPLSITVGVAAL